MSSPAGRRRRRPAPLCPRARPPQAQSPAAHARARLRPPAPRLVLELASLPAQPRPQPAPASPHGLPLAGGVASCRRRLTASTGCRACGGAPILCLALQPRRPRRRRAAPLWQGPLAAAQCYPPPACPAAPPGRGPVEAVTADAARRAPGRRRGLLGRGAAAPGAPPAAGPGPGEDASGAAAAAAAPAGLRGRRGGLAGAAASAAAAAAAAPSAAAAAPSAAAGARFLLLPVLLPLPLLPLPPDAGASWQRGTSGAAGSTV
jgi:hypothetical protein